jgi:electron transfer flavoprotein alpha subunit
LKEKEKMQAETVVIASLADGRPAPVTLELIAFARALRRDESLPVAVFVLGEGIAAAAAELAALPGVAVTGFEGKSLAAYSAEAWKGILAPCLAGLKPRFVFIAHDALGADFAPGLAARLQAACITSVDGFRREEEEIVFSRPLLKGKMQMEIVPEARTTVVTLAAGTFRSREATGAQAPQTAAPEGHAPAKAEILPIPDLELSTRPLGRLPAPEQAADLAAAQVIVAAGRGIGSEENIVLLRQLASCFSHSALGASRAVCDAGWLPCRLQVGQTGKTVAPRLYIACGISGALQHLAGMRGSQCIVAINRDPRAAIFQFADIAVVEELVSFIPLLIDACGQGPAPAAGAGR